MVGQRLRLISRCTMQFIHFINGLAALIDLSHIEERKNSQHLMAIFYYFALTQNKSDTTSLLKQ